MKTTGVNEVRALVAEAIPNATAAQKLTDAIVRATELVEDETYPVTRDYLDARLTALASDLRKDIADLRADMQTTFRDQTWKLAGSFIFVVVVATVIQHYWR